MADEALFIGWGEVVRGRERTATQVFDETVRYFGGLQQDGTVESFDAWFLEPHGGDLAGFFLIRGERARLDEMRRTPEFERVLARAGTVIDGLGVVSAYTGDALGRLMGQFQEASAELAG